MNLLIFLSMLGFTEPVCRHLQNLHEELAKSSGSCSRFHLNFIARKNKKIIMQNYNNLFAELLPIQSSTAGWARYKETSLNELTQTEIYTPGADPHQFAAF